MKTIKVTCDGTDYIDYKKLLPFQGYLKTLSADNLNRLKKSIIKYGFTVPAFVWKSNKKLYILDAHQRQLALESLAEDGYTIPDIPIVYIKAKDKKEAKEKLLQITSQYGKFDKGGLNEFLLSIDSDADFIDSIRLADGLFSIHFDNPTNPYEEWNGMPEYINEDVSGFKDILIHFMNEEDRNAFAKLLKQKITLKTKYLWYPKREPISEKDRIYTDES